VGYNSSKHDICIDRWLWLHTISPSTEISIFHVIFIKTKLQHKHSDTVTQTLHYMTSKAKVNMPKKRHKWRAHLSMAIEPVSRQTTESCDAWPLRSQTHGYLSSHTATLPFDQYQIILVSEQRQLTQGCYLAVQQAGVKPATSRSLVWHATISPCKKNTANTGI